MNILVLEKYQNVDINSYLKVNIPNLKGLTKTKPYVAIHQSIGLALSFVRRYSNFFLLKGHSINYVLNSQRDTNISLAKCCVLSKN